MSIARFGDQSRFSVGFEFVKDPEKQSPSWGTFSLWVAGRNLTSGRSLAGEFLENATVPLLPLVQFIVDNWDALLHEERLPTRSTATAGGAEWSVEAFRDLPTDFGLALDVTERIQAWRARHSLGAALSGFRIPDVCIRRVGPRVEVSWDDRAWRSTGEGVECSEPPGVALLRPEEVAEPLYHWCGEILKGLRHAELPVVEFDVERLFNDWKALDDDTRIESRLEFAAALDINHAARRLRQRLGIKGSSVIATVRALLGVSKNSQAHGLYADLPPPVLLFRSASPTLSEDDLHTLIRLADPEAPDGSIRLNDLRRSAPCRGTPADITADGYARAVALRESLGVPEDAPLTAEWDIEQVVLRRLDVRVENVTFDDADVEGVAIFGPGRRPTIAVNQNGRASRTRWGRRMTVAHELCHLLYDGDEVGNVGVVSNPWAAYPLERRANAFAAMLLAPEPALARHLSRDSSRWTVQDLRGTCEALGVGVTTLTRNLQNFGWIGDGERWAWQDRLANT